MRKVEWQFADATVSEDFVGEIGLLQNLQIYAT